MVNDWACLGQRTTASGTVLADNLPVNPFHLFPTWKSYASPTLAGPFAQLTTAAIDAGIARAALDDTVAFVRHSARPWIDAGVARASDDPLTIYHIGQLDSRLAAADARCWSGRDGCSTAIKMTSARSMSPRRRWPSPAPKSGPPKWRWRPPAACSSWGHSRHR
ncbi:hypothetical protein LNO81_16310 [Klebsiella variicola subsp. variicola]|nr:hypothetical protein [Klebsiella variicola subsp. variicola]